MTTKQKQDIVNFLKNRGCNKMSIEEMLTWCEETGATTIEEVHQAGINTDWWDRSGKLNYE